MDRAVTDWLAPGVAVPELGTVQETVTFAEAAAAAGAQVLWCAGGWGYGPMPLLGMLAERTDAVLGTGIANAFARSPGALAMDALALHGATEGRFVLGVGTGTPLIAEGFHGVPFERPVRRVRETIEVVRLALAGERIDYDGAVFDLEGMRLYGVPDGGVEVPIVAAALGRTNRAMALDFADGITTYLLPLDAIPDALEAARSRSTTGGSVPVVAQVPTCVSADPAEARSLMARHLAYYVGALDVYHDVVADHGFRAVAEDIRSAWQADDRDRARERVPAELMDAVGVVGTPERARERLDALAAGPADAIVLSFPEGAGARMRELALEALAEHTA